MVRASDGSGLRARSTDQRPKIVLELGHTELSSVFSTCTDACGKHAANRSAPRTVWNAKEPVDERHGPVHHTAVGSSFSMAACLCSGARWAYLVVIEIVFGQPTPAPFGLDSQSLQCRGCDGATEVRMPGIYYLV